MENDNVESRDVDEELHRGWIMGNPVGSTETILNSVWLWSWEKSARNKKKGRRHRHKREKSHDRKLSVERRHDKKKERVQSEEEDGYVDGGTKKARVDEEWRGMKRFEEYADENWMGEEKKENRRFEDADEDKDSREERKGKFEDLMKKEEGGDMNSNGSNVYLQMNGGPTKEGSLLVAVNEELKTLSISSGSLPPLDPSGSSSSAIPTNVPQSGLAEREMQKYDAAKKAKELGAKLGVRADPDSLPLLKRRKSQFVEEGQRSKDAELSEFQSQIRECVIKEFMANQMRLARGQV